MVNSTGAKFGPTFEFEPNQLRQRALAMLAGRDHDSAVTNELSASSDFVERQIGEQLCARPGKDTTSGNQVNLLRLAGKNPMTDAYGGRVFTDKINRVARFSEMLQAEFGKKFIGIVIAGSLSKGYATPESDIDMSIIGQDENIVEFGRRNARELGAVHFSPRAYYVHCDGGLVPQIKPRINDDLYHPLFQGIFIGNRTALDIARAQFVAGVSDPEWNESRRRMVKSELDSRTKRQARFALTARQEHDLQLMALLQRIPPRYSELSTK